MLLFKCLLSMSENKPSKMSQVSIIPFREKWEYVLQLMKKTSGWGISQLVINAVGIVKCKYWKNLEKSSWTLLVGLFLHFSKC